MKELSFGEIKAAADPVATCKEQLRRCRISYSRYGGSRKGGRYYEEKIAALEDLLRKLKEEEEEA